MKHEKIKFDPDIKKIISKFLQETVKYVTKSEEKCLIYLFIMIIHYH